MQKSHEIPHSRGTLSMRETLADTKKGLPLQPQP